MRDPLRIAVGHGPMTIRSNSSQRAARPVHHRGSLRAAPWPVLNARLDRRQPQTRSRAAAATDRRRSGPYRACGATPSPARTAGWTPLWQACCRVFRNWRPFCYTCWSIVIDRWPHRRWPLHSPNCVRRSLICQIAFPVFFVGNLDAKMADSCAFGDPQEAWKSEIFQYFLVNLPRTGKWAAETCGACTACTSIPLLTRALRLWPRGLMGGN